MTIKSRSGKSVVYHIPKCGGVWVKEAMRRSGVKYDRCRGSGRKFSFGLVREHAPPDGVAEEDREGRFAFCFVRHPVGWLKSFWCYRVKTGRLDAKFPPDACWDDCFEPFVLNLLDAYPGGFVTHLYQHYVGDVDFVGRQESLADDLVMALTLAGEEFDEVALRALGRRNVSGGKERMKKLLMLSDGTRERTLGVERWVVERYYA